MKLMNCMKWTNQMREEVFHYTYRGNWDCSRDLFHRTKRPSELMRWSREEDSPLPQDSPLPPHPKNHKNIGFLSNTGPDLLNITKLSSQHSITVRPSIIGTPAKCHLNGVSLAGWWWPTYTGIWILPHPSHQRKKHCQSWTPTDKTFWIRVWSLKRNSLTPSDYKMCSVLDCKSEKEAGKKIIPLTSVMERRTFLTGVSESTVYRFAARTPEILNLPENDTPSQQVWPWELRRGSD